MDLGLEGRAFVVGGGSRGLGRAVADELVVEGAKVLLVARDQDSLDEAVRELGPQHAYACAADVSAPDAAETVAAAVDAELGRLDGILVNHGGPPAGRTFELTDDQWTDSFQLVVGGPIRLLRALVPKLGDGASVVFITSWSIREPVPNLDASNVLRPGVAGLVKVLAQELAPGVRVNSVAPGRFATERGMSLARTRAEEKGVSVEDAMAEMAGDIPLGRYGDPPELARLAAFLLSPAASYVNGVNVLADGGLIAALP
ncbi:MAG: SDR family oxidoreductase [Actinobacteria bacterium]|nr:SDR family oxidoreductase [Actinomycetota bacterium]